MSARQEPVRTHRNSEVVAAARLHRARERSTQKLTLLEGPHLLAEALETGLRPEVVFGTTDDLEAIELSRNHELRFVPVDLRALARLSGTETPRGPVAVIAVPKAKAPTTEGVLVAWGVSDPGNVGTMVRTAAAFAWDFCHGGETADPWSPKVLRAGAGAHFRSRVAQLGSIGDLKSLGYEAVATTPTDGVAPHSLEPGRYAVVIGEEAHGLPESIVEDCTHRVTIPMPGGTESLNAAVAAAIIVYQLTLTRDRRA